MAREKKPVHKVQMTEGKRNIIHQLLKEYDIQSAEDIQDALKDLRGGTIKEMMEAEMDDHLGYEKMCIRDSISIVFDTATAEDVIMHILGLPTDIFNVYPASVKFKTYQAVSYTHLVVYSLLSPC